MRVNARGTVCAEAAVLGLAVLAGLGCTGGIGDSSGPGGSASPTAPGAPGSPGSTTTPGSSTTPGASGMPAQTIPPGGSIPPTVAGECSGDVPEVGIRRLSRFEYDNTLRDLGLLATDARLALDGFSGDGTVGGAKKGFSVGGPVDVSVARDLVGAATTLAAKFAADPKFVGCAPTSAAEEDTCARTFIMSFGRRAFRRPLVKAEIDELFQVFATARMGFDFKTGIETALASMLVAPEFLYLVERSPDGSARGSIVSLDGFALASRLSYFLWESTPDTQLLQAAESGALLKEAQLETEIRRLINDPRARAAVNHFIREWSFADDLDNTPKDKAQFPFYTPDFALALKASLLASLEGVFWGAEPTLQNFFATKTMFVNTAMAKAYGMDAVTATRLVEVPLDPAQRRGLLTHPALLSLNAKPTRGDPIHRGLFVRKQVLCTPLPDPPEKDENGNPINFTVAPPAPGVSNRDRFKQHTASPACSGCHNMIDPIGFGFENYDATGRFRTVDESRNPIDAHGEVFAGGDLTGPFNGAVELVDRVSKSEAVAQCASTQWFRFALARAETTADACTGSKVLKRYLKAGANLKELLVALATSDAFRYRKVGAGEGGVR